MDMQTLTCRLRDALDDATMASLWYFLHRSASDMEAVKAAINRMIDLHATGAFFGLPFEVALDDAKGLVVAGWVGDDFEPMVERLPF
jgi:hypothetical protein